MSDTAWVEVDEAQQGRPTDEPRKRYRMIASGQQVRGFPFSARLLDQVAVPPLVASRVLLRTTLGSDEESRTHAWYLIETHASHVSFSLPEHASWVRARIDGRSAEQIELDPALAGYRLGLPSDSRAGPVLVEIEYQLSKASPHHGCLPPRLLEGAVALETLWEVQIPWNVAVIGVPEGWSDENQWYWDSYVWKRRPWKSFARLVGWVAGPTSQTPGLEGVSDDEREDAARLSVRPVRSAGPAQAVGGIAGLDRGPLLGDHARPGILVHVFRYPLSRDMGRCGDTLLAGCRRCPPQHRLVDRPILLQRPGTRFPWSGDPEADRPVPVGRPRRRRRVDVQCFGRGGHSTGIGRRRLG